MGMLDKINKQKTGGSLLNAGNAIMTSETAFRNQYSQDIDRLSHLKKMQFSD
jgi:hypothetical protein